jgi:hypothetical protein
MRQGRLRSGCRPAGPRPQYSARPQAYDGKRNGGGGGNRTRVHGRLGGVSTGLAGALISLAAPASAGRRLPAPISLGCDRSEQRDRTPAHFMTPRIPATGEPGAMRYLTRSGGECESVFSASIWFRQFNEATGPRPAAPTSVQPMSRPVRPHGQPGGCALRVYQTPETAKPRLSRGFACERWWYPAIRSVRGVAPHGLGCVGQSSTVWTSRRSRRRKYMLRQSGPSPEA